jgi:2-oxo-3-hexenedioate decarboxylase/2-keto-4-pentenoate hydratase
MDDMVAAGARLIFDERREQTQFHNLADNYYPQGETSAYAIQDGLDQLLKENGAGGCAGYKIALSTPTMQELLGTNRPCMGVLHEKSIWTSPHAIHLNDHMHLGMECEIAVRMGADLTPQDAPFTRESVAQLVDTCFPAFEVIDDRNADYANSDFCSLIADNCWNTGVILGTEIKNWRILDFTATRGALVVNGIEVAHGYLSDAMGHPFEAVAWLANQMSERSRTIARSSLIMTGSIVPTKFAQPGDTVKYVVDDVGEVSATFE